MNKPSCHGLSQCFIKYPLLYNSGSKFWKVQGGERLGQIDAALGERVLITFCCCHTDHASLRHLGTGGLGNFICSWVAVGTV